MIELTSRLERKLETWLTGVREGVLVPSKVELVERPDSSMVLAWELDGSEELRSPPDADTDVLSDLLDLAEPSGLEPDPKAILRIAGRYGPLYTCSHGLPFTHDSRWKAYHDPDVSPAEFPRLLRVLERFDLTPQPEACRPVGYEPVSLWHTWASRLRSVERLSRMIRKGYGTYPQDWKALEESVWFVPGGYAEAFAEVLKPQDDEPFQRLDPGGPQLAGHLNRWMEYCGFRWIVAWTDGGPRSSFTGVGVLALALRRLALGLLGAAADLKVCKHCGRLFEPSSPRKEHCSRKDCIRERNKLAKRRQREREGSEGQ